MLLELLLHFVFSGDFLLLALNYLSVEFLLFLHSFYIFFDVSLILGSPFILNPLLTHLVFMRFQNIMIDFLQFVVCDHRVIAAKNIGRVHTSIWVKVHVLNFTLLKFDVSRSRMLKFEQFLGIWQDLVSGR